MLREVSHKLLTELATKRFIRCNVEFEKDWLAFKTLLPNVEYLAISLTMFYPRVVKIISEKCRANSCNSEFPTGEQRNSY